MEDNLTHDERLAPSVTLSRKAQDVHVVFSDVEVIVRDKDGNLKSRSVQRNLRTNVGADFWNTQLFATGAAGAQANYIGLTTDSTAPAATDTSLASEETANGLGRAQATITHSAGASSSLLSHTWTYTGSTQKVIAKAGLFTAAGPPIAGTMALETLLSSTATVNSNGDQITLNWTVNY